MEMSISQSDLDVSSNEQDQQILSIVLDHTSNGVLMTDANRKILYVNQAFSDVTGYPKSDVIGKNPKLLQSGLQDKSFYKEMWTSINQFGFWEGEIWNRRKNGDCYPEWLNIKAIPNKNGDTLYYLGIFSDITRQKNQEESLKYLAYFDTLTSLPNRNYLRKRFHEALEEAHRKDNKMCLLYIDLDDFKAVNDTYGHYAGDQLLMLVAERLKKTFGRSGTVCRLGGDEFVVLLPKLEKGQTANDSAAQLAAAFEHPFLIVGNELQIGLSMGMSLYPEDGTELEELLKSADAKMYLKKNVFGPIDTTPKDKRMQEQQWRARIERAIEKDEFQLYYQPQFDLTSRQLVGAEALLRWNSPELGFLTPADFIPIAEETDLILPIGEWVFRKACQDSQTLRKQGLALHIAVNLSAKQFQQKDFASKLREIVQNEGALAEELDLEITETAFMENFRHSIQIISDIKDLGIRFSLDDFGTGYSSLSYLSRLPIDILKIDRSFIHDMLNSETNAIIVRTIIAMAKNLNLKVIAEGIETDEQLDHLQMINCDMGQGFLFGQPVPLHEFVSQYAESKMTF